MTPNLTCGLYAFVDWCSLLCAYARAFVRGGFCIVRNGVVAMLPWELKCALSGCRLVFQLNMRSLRERLLVQPTLFLRARAVVRGGFCIVRNRMVAMEAWKPQ